MHRKILLYLFLSIGLLLASCSDDDNPSDGGDTPKEMSAKVDGESWSTSTAQAQLAGSTMKVFGTSTGNESISLSLTETSVGDHTGGIASYSIGTTEAYMALSFDYSITEYNESDKIIAGTFSFTTMDVTGQSEVKEITDGTFRVKIVN